MNYQQLINYLCEYQNYILNFSGLSHYSKKSYINDLKQFRIFLSEHSSAADIENFSHLLLDYFQVLEYVKHLKSATIKRKFIVLHKFFNYLEQNQLLCPNPFHLFSYKLPREKHLPKVLQKQDLLCLITTIQERIPLLSPYYALIATRDLAIIDLLICTGMRIGEITKLRLHDYNQSTNTLLINGKGEKERILYISSSDVVNELSKWLCVRSGLNPKCDSLFINKYGNTFSIYGIENIFYKYRKFSGIDTHSTPHYLRHTFASADTFAA